MRILLNLIFILMILFFKEYSFAQENIDYYFNTANTSYLNKDYDNAILMYKKIIESGFYSGSVYYNIGNCYFRKQDYAMAMVYYQKAKKLISNNKDLKNNITIINNLYIKNKIEEKKWWGFIIIDFVADKLNIKGWTILSFIFYISICLLILVYIKNRKSFIYDLVFYLSLVFIIIAGFTSYKFYNDCYIKKGVIIKDDISIKSGPLAEYDDLFKLNSGIVCKILEKTDDWVRIRLVNGLEGWILFSSIEKI